MSDSHLTIDARDGSGSFTAYVARPNGVAKAAVIVIQEIFGVNAGIRQKCDTLAAAGRVRARRFTWDRAAADLAAGYRAAASMGENRRA